MMKLLGQYSQQQGIYTKAHACLTNFTAETWGFLQLQFCDVFPESEYGTSVRIRAYHVTESGLVVKAARVHRTCAIMRFETKSQFHWLCQVFGESATAGQ
jgi:hypothetical protein